MNRKQKRAQQAAATASPTSSSSRILTTADEIPYSQPERSRPNSKTKTLYEIAAEKQAELLPQAQRLNLNPNGRSAPTAADVVNIKIGSNGQIIKDKRSRRRKEGGYDDNDADGEDYDEQDQDEDEEEDEEEEEAAIPPLIDSALLASSLSAIHFTLETLTVHQYAQELQWPPIVKHTLFVAFPTLFLLIHLCHGHIFSLSDFCASLFSSSSSSSTTSTGSHKEAGSGSESGASQARKVIWYFQQLLYVGVANWSGCYLIHLTNDKGYYAVMKTAPAIGTVWVWMVIELGLIGALAGVIGPAIYAWRYGYGIF